MSSWINQTDESSIIVNGLHPSAPKNTHNLSELQCCLCDARQEKSKFPWLQIAQEMKKSNQTVDVYLNCVFVDQCLTCILSLTWLLKNGFNVYSKDWSKLHYNAIEMFIENMGPQNCSNKVELMIYGDSSSAIECHSKELKGIKRLQEVGFPYFYH